MPLTGEPAGPRTLDDLEADLDGWLGDLARGEPTVSGVERGEPGQRRWYVRLRGEERDITAVWLTLGQRTLAVEVYVLPAPEENHAAFYEHLLRRNLRTVGLRFAVGAEDAVYLVGEIPLENLSAGALDAVIGSVYDTVERCFRPALRIGFASRFGASS